MKELTNYQEWQQNKYGDILPTPVILPTGEVYESTAEEMERLSEWIDMQAEKQLYESEK